MDNSHELIAIARSSGQAGILAQLWQRAGAWLTLHPNKTVALVALMALMIGIARVWSDPPIVTSGETDHWWPNIQNVAQGKGYTDCHPEYFPFCRTANQATAQREPAPVMLFAAVSLLTNGSLLAAAIVEVALHIGILLAVYHLGREIADTRTGLIAALIWAIYLQAIKLLPQVSGDLLSTLSLTWGLLFYMHGQRKGQMRNWLLAGLCLGLSTLSRSANSAIALVLAACLVPWKQVIGHRNLSGFFKDLRPALLFSATFALLLAPWVARNYIVFGRPIIGSTLVGYNLFRHNHILASDGYLRYVDNIEAKQAVEALLARRTDLRGDENESQMDDVYREEATQIIAAHPFRYLALSLYRLAPLWLNWQIKEAYGYEPTGLDHMVFTQQVVILIAALIGLGSGPKRGWPLTATVITATLTYIGVVSRMRYIVGVMPLVIIFSAVGVILLFRLVRSSLITRAAKL